MTGFTKITVLLPPDVPPLYIEAARRILSHRDVEVLQGEPAQRTAVIHGIVIEALVADFLAGPAPQEAP